MSILLKGAPVAAGIIEDIEKRTAILKERGITPGLAVLRVGDKPDDIYYENAAVKKCEKVGMIARRVTLPADADVEILHSALKELREDSDIHGILALRPMPKELETVLLNEMPPKKDVDGITSGSLASVFSGYGDGFAPCTAEACIEILDYYGIEISGKNAVVLGRSLVIGKPVSMLLLKRNATVTVCHTKTADIASHTKKADIVITCAGKIGAFSADMASSGQYVVDVGMNSDGNGGFKGDADGGVFDIAEAITPVPGGVGAVTTALLLRHVVESAEKEYGVLESLK